MAGIESISEQQTEGEHHDEVHVNSSDAMNGSSPSTSDASTNVANRTTTAAANATVTDTSYALDSTKGDTELTEPVISQKEKEIIMLKKAVAHLVSRSEAWGFLAKKKEVFSK